MNITMNYFRLFDLPLDLLELLTLYFEENEAVKVLTVSSNFHEIFARSVWHTITRETIGVAEPTRSSAFARYGHLVRSIQLYNKFDIELDLYNWAQLFPNVTSMVFDILYDMKEDVVQTFVDAIADLHGLRSLEIDMDSNWPPFEFETLARVLVARHKDPNKQSVRKLTIAFCSAEDNRDYDDDDEEKLWPDLSSFVQTLSPLRPSINLKIDMSGYSCIYAPTPAQMDIPRPYLASTPSLDKLDNEDGCMALLNRQIFSPSGTRDNPLVFGRLDRLYISACCSSPLLFDYSDFTPAKFPVMECMNITEVKCNHQTAEGADSAIQVLLLQKWPMLSRLNVDVNGLTLSTLDRSIELNPQLTSLYIQIRGNINDVDNVFNLERLAGRLPHLTSFTLYGGSSNVVDSEWLQTDSLVDVRSSKLAYVTIRRTTVTPQLLEVLLALPSLRDVSLWNCVLVEPELVMNVLKMHRETVKEGTKVGIRRLTISSWHTDGCWTTELGLELVACLPHLRSCAIHDNDALKNAIKEKYPHIRL
ncbi:hypothetical protein GQ42DRAFT_176171 [Ramicandelaber brevisporus]|nr:hypothetical protein GQ42DRAFT_176171 [Ramicandelaber brevisporus]